MYGIAVRRGVLRSLGAKPAVYGDDRVYARLAEPERYRFQLSLSTPSASWRHEREWRLKGDLPLDKIFVTSRQVASNEQRVRNSFTRNSRPVDPQPGFPGFVFVQTNEEKEKLCSHINSGLPIVALNP